MAILIGIDLGTTHVKVGAYTDTGTLCALERCERRLRRLSRGGPSIPQAPCGA